MVLLRFCEGRQADRRTGGQAGRRETRQANSAVIHTASLLGFCEVVFAWAKPVQAASQDDGYSVVPFSDTWRKVHGKSDCVPFISAGFYFVPSPPLATSAGR